MRRKLLRRAPKSVASRYYQLLSGHTAIGPYLKDKVHKADDGRCQWCRGGKKQTRHHLFMEYGVQGLWEDMEGSRAETPKGPVG